MLSHVLVRSAMVYGEKSRPNQLKKSAPNIQQTVPESRSCFHLSDYSICPGLLEPLVPSANRDSITLGHNLLSLPILTATCEMRQNYTRRVHEGMLEIYSRCYTSQTVIANTCRGIEVNA